MDLITGKPGSGKTLLAIKLLTDRYFFWHNKDKCFYRQKKYRDYVIFTNIDGFKLEHKNLVEIFRDVPFETFFTKLYQDRIHKKYPKIIYIIDECQAFIGPYFRNKDVIFYFDYHRHYGDKVWLISQDITKINRQISTLHSQEYRAVNRTFTIFGEFRYNIKDNGTIFKRKSFKPDKRLFDLYKSFSGDDQEKRTNPIRNLIVLLTIAFLCFGYYFYNKIQPDDLPNDSLKHTELKQSSSRDYRHSNEKKDDSISSKVDQTSEYINKLRAVPITGWVQRKDKLYMFIDPIRNKPISIIEAEYPVKQFPTGYYAILNAKQWREYQAWNAEIASSQPDDQPRYSNKDRYASK
jgi:hypothetical protein